MTEPAPAVLVLGLGNELRRDDGAGAAVARRLRSGPLPPGIDVREEPGEPIGLLDAWEGRAAVVLVDAMRSGAAPGTVRRFDAGCEPLPHGLRGSSSTHALGLAQAIELARELGRLPARVLVHAVEGRDFAAGPGCSEEVRAAVPGLAGAVLDDAGALARGENR